jgi:rifampicin phosphotransferase
LSFVDGQIEAMEYDLNFGNAVFLCHNIHMIISFTSPEATLENAGGKGANLVRLSRAGFNVPRGFMISTEAYREFVKRNTLAERIEAATIKLALEDTNALEDASQTIRAAFSAGVMPSDITTAIVNAYHELHSENEKAVAVRSSATAEDLPDLSFAGQQDTYLNVIGEQQLLKAVIDCWSSLWTGRAIGYRTRNHISHDEAALAVVVQEMVPSDVSGVLFTANPLTGLLSESVIDAAFGLGEALVSGQVEPDHFVVNSISGEINGKTLGAKKISTRGKTGGGVESIPAEDASARQTLSADQIRGLVATGGQIEKEYNAPQDIEWAFADNKLYILQSRAITSLFPVPQISVDPLIIWISFGAVQGLVGPITPLGRDTIRQVMAGGARMLGVRARPEEIDVFAMAGERVWIKFSDVMRNPLGSRIFKGALGFIEPSTGQILHTLSTDPRVELGKGKFKLSTVGRIIRFFIPILLRVVRNVLRPQNARARFDADIETYLVTAKLAPGTNHFERLANLVAFIRERIANVFAFLLPRFIPIFAPSAAALGLLTQLSGDSNLALEVTRGLPNNVTTEMDLVLWETAQAIKADPESKARFTASGAPELASQYLSGTLPPASQTVIARFLDKYGVRGVGEIDFGQPRWREEPAPVIHTLQSYLQIDAAFAPNIVFAKGEQAAQAAIEKIAAKVRKEHGGWLKEKVVRASARRIRLLMGVRESPKFFAIRTMGIARKALLEVGKEFVDGGTIDSPADLIFLNLAELEELSKSAAESTEKNSELSVAKSWKSLIAERKAVYERELRRRQVPRVLVSDGRAFYEGMGSETDTNDVITGSPVSAGVVEGIVHVVLDPRGTQLAPGEILVCPGTDPAWTPLFMAAGGLVTEVGGMMTHGSVVAREYGIPAVVGVHQATIRLKDGQRIRVDGTQGKITVLDG